MKPPENREVTFHDGKITRKIYHPKWHEHILSGICAIMGIDGSSQTTWGTPEVSDQPTQWPTDEDRLLIRAMFGNTPITDEDITKAVGIEDEEGRTHYTPVYTNPDRSVFRAERKKRERTRWVLGISAFLATLPICYTLACLYAKDVIAEYTLSEPIPQSSPTADSFPTERVTAIPLPTASSLPTAIPTSDVPVNIEKIGQNLKSMRTVAPTSPPDQTNQWICGVIGPDETYFSTLQALQAWVNENNNENNKDVFASYDFGIKEKGDRTIKEIPNWRDATLVHDGDLACVQP